MEPFAGSSVSRLEVAKVADRIGVSGTIAGEDIGRQMAQANAGTNSQQRLRPLREPGVRSRVALPAS
jgi:hypothetical protein